MAINTEGMEVLCSHVALATDNNAVIFTGDDLVSIKVISTDTHKTFENEAGEQVIMDNVAYAHMIAMAMQAAAAREEAEYAELLKVGSYVKGKGTDTVH